MTAQPVDIAMFSGEVHPLADGLPMLGSDELADLADSIRRNGLFDPITLDPKGVLLDGRNRLAACGIAEVEPRFEVHAGDPIELIVARGATRRNVSAGQRAMLLARGMWARGEWDEDAERWHQGAIGRVLADARTQIKVNSADVTMAGAILAYSEDWAAEVLSGVRTLRATYDTVVAERKEAAERKSQMETLRDAHPDLHAHVLDETDPMTLKEAYAAYLERTKAERKVEQEHKDAIRRKVSWLNSFLMGYRMAAGMATSPSRDEVLAELDPFDRDRFLTIEKAITWPSTLI